MSEIYEAKVEKKILSIDEALSNLNKKVGPLPDDNKPESKEKFVELDLAKDNFKIPSLTDKQKVNMKLGETIDGWTKEVIKTPISGKMVSIIIIKKQIDSVDTDSVVREYVTNVPEHLIGEQLFTWAAVKTLAKQGKIDIKNLPSYAYIRTINLQNDELEDFLEDNFQKDGEDIFPGYWNPSFNTFYDIGESPAFWLSDGQNIVLDSGFIFRDNDHAYGFSVRLLEPE